MRGEVVESEPFRRLVFTWDDERGGDERPSRVTYEIEPVGAVCRLTVVHDDFHGVSKVWGIAKREWPLVLARLKTAIETGTTLDVTAPTPSSDAEVGVEAEDHRAWGRASHGRTWELLEIDSRDGDQTRELLEAAYASAWHWRHGGTARNEQRAEWLLSRVHAVLGDAPAVRRHAERCWTITEREGFGDFDRAYACEAQYRAYAVAGDDTAAKEWHERALAATDDIADPEDRELSLADLAS